MKRAVLREHSLLDIFFFIFPVSVFEKVRKWTDVNAAIYAYPQPVQAVKANNRDGQPTGIIRFIP